MRGSDGQSSRVAKFGWGSVLFDGLVYGDVGFFRFLYVFGCNWVNDYSDRFCWGCVFLVKFLFNLCIFFFDFVQFDFFVFLNIFCKIM